MPFIASRSSARYIGNATPDAHPNSPSQSTRKVNARTHFAVICFICTLPARQYNQSKKSPLSIFVGIFI